MKWKEKLLTQKSDSLAFLDETSNPKLKVRGSLSSKKFELSQNEKLKELLGIGEGSREIKDFWALRNVNFDVYDGEAIGIVGLNGSGKSTLLNIIDQSLSVTTGELEINGEVSHIAIGAGLKVDLTGRDNIRLKGMMMGMSKKEIEEKMDEIIQFSELGPFIDRQVKGYSSGLRSKLAFSIAVNQDPDILIIDEALSVGDSTFAAKSAKKMFEFRECGKTIFVVSHNTSQIQKWTDKVVWLHYGEVKEYGSTQEILPKYQAFIDWFNKLSKEQQEQYKLDRRQEQLDYSVEALKQEIIDNSSSEVSQTSLAIIDRTIVKNKMKLTWSSKVVMCFCVIFMMFNVVISVKGGSTDKGNQPKVGKPSSVTKSSQSSKKSSASKPQKSSTSKKSSSKTVATFDYIVQEGDTFNGIASAYGLSSDDVLKLNPGLDPALITVGMVIKLPKSVEGKVATPESAANTGQTTTDVSDDSAYSGQGDDYTSYPTTPPEIPAPSTPITDPSTPDQGGTDRGGTVQGENNLSP
ncbi:ATP-binding cassette domain-containing protein [Pseudolactococcus yaeyamensis]